MIIILKRSAEEAW